MTVFRSPAAPRSRDLDPFPVDGMAFPPQQNVQATVAEMPSLLGEGFQPLAQRLVARSHALTSARSSDRSRSPGRPAARSSRRFGEIRRRLPSCRGRHHFFPRDPSPRRCRALNRPASAPADRSRPPGLSAVWPLTLSDRRTWPSTYKTSPRHACGRPPPWETQASCSRRTATSTFPYTLIA